MVVRQTSKADHDGVGEPGSASRKADLVLEGGGVKGIALVGAIQVLEEHGYTFNRVAGTSAGSIVGALLAAGMSGEDMYGVMKGLDYSNFQDAKGVSRLGLPGKAASLLFRMGIYQGDYLKSWLSGQLAGLGVTTFGDLPKVDSTSTGADDTDYRLVVMSSNVSHQEISRLPWDLAGSFGLEASKFPVADAVRASMSIPFFYRPARIGPKSNRSTMVDGGMLSNFPVAIFDRPTGTPRWPTFGIKLSARPKTTLDNSVTGTISLAKALLGTMTGWYDQQYVAEPSVQARTIFIDTFNTKATDFNLDEATAQKLYANGRAAATAFLDGAGGTPGWDFDEYKRTYRTTPPTETDEAPRSASVSAG